MYLHFVSWDYERIINYGITRWIWSGLYNVNPGWVTITKETWLINLWGTPKESWFATFFWYHPKWNGRVLSIQGRQLYCDLDCLWMIYLGLSEKDGIPQSLANHRGKHIFNPYSKKPIFGWYQDDIWIYGGFIKNRATPSYHPFIDRFFPLTIHLGYSRGHGNRLSRRP